MFIRTEKQFEALGERLGRQIANGKWRIATRQTSGHKLYAISDMPARARVLALVGELGSGKTTFVRGFARGLGVRSRITSPTFILARRHRIPLRENPKHEARNSKQYQSSKLSKNSKHVSDFDIRISNLKYLWHFDLYRLRGARDLSSVHFREVVADPGNVVVIEWADRVKAAIPKDAISIELKHHGKGRVLRFPRKLL